VASLCGEDSVSTNGMRKCMDSERVRTFKWTEWGLRDASASKNASLNLLKGS
jgi:hypothetical protein